MASTRDGTTGTDSDGSSRSRDQTASATDDPIVEVRNVSVTYDLQSRDAMVLDDVSLDLRRGEILGCVGESGSGKSMLANAMMDAVEEPGITTGDVRYYSSKNADPVHVLDLSGDDLKQFRWEEVSMVFQGALSSFNPTMTIGGHFEETLKAHDYDVEEGMERARQLLSDLYLDPERVLNAYAHELSGGMSQRALIALSLILEPDVLLMDEPTAALDLLMQRSILSLLDDIKEKYELSILFITHDLPLVAGLADRLAILYAFELAEVGPSERIVRDSAHPYTRALLKAVPNLDAPLDTMKPIEGTAPNPAHVPNGCHYAPRCPLADERCHEEKPEWFDAGTDQRSACFHHERADEAVPFDVASVTAAVEEADTATDADDAFAAGGATGGDALAAPDDETVVSLDDVSIHFEEEQGLLDSLTGEPETVQAVDDVSIDIPENDVLALVGESGCGKTTLGKAIIGVQRPTEGTVTYRGQNVWDAKDRVGNPGIEFGDIRRALQIIHQDPGASLNPNQKVVTSLEAPLKRWDPDLSTEDRRARIYALLDRVGMQPPEDYANRFPHQLSGGEQQRVALVRALLMNPDVILADEAVSALDVSLRVETMDLLLELQEQFNTSFVFISHTLSNARYLAEKADGRIGIMYLGELVEVGPPDEVLNDPQHPYTKVLRWATANLDPSDQEMTEPPVRSIDIPDPVDPPTGCRFHTRCPEAREACVSEAPELGETESTPDERAVACHRANPNHHYWSSQPLDGVDAAESPGAGD
ncbi:oligopeptide/dipeptide ABC transporter, ATPase subunit [Halosimplex carlsbadense 2-9-1]|uniref:Oligopeptide/dipeptide ABC transporter, ATPase subunit n=1 Tax=Halosimplex carlsbadense 2-9-1 TaxID=797114 RepID=M0CJ70_9EURY|nr:ABC transporter ATP-binding protein [Halosimplex carlsbadense]ELZ22668.1 oligopeptide/dipeptide ABC transporter, ATPase subunit [Halosimplex carlsbadense 2-9-1]